MSRRLSQSWVVYACHVLTITVGISALFRAPAQGQDVLEGPVVALYDREPFDRLTLDKANDFRVVEVFPLELADRSRPVADVERRTFRIRRLQDPATRLFDVDGKAIDRLELYPEVLLLEAKRLISAKELDQAFPYIERLMRDFSDFAGVKETVEQHHLADAAQRFRLQEFDQALLSLDEVFALNPTRPDLDRVLRVVLGQTLEVTYARKEYVALRRTLAFARAKYGTAIDELIATWESRLRREATEMLEQARKLFEDHQPTEALALTRIVESLTPADQAATKLRSEILASYPRVRVGVSQSFDAEGGTAMQDRALLWSERRARPLTRRSLVSFREFTADGGVYGSSLCKLIVSSDRKSVELQFGENQAEPQVPMYRLARNLLLLANPSWPSHDPMWAGILKSLQATPTPGLKIELNRPTLRPEAYLPWLAPTGHEGGEDDGRMDQLLKGPFEEIGGTTSVQTYQRRERGPKDQRVLEIDEVAFSDSAAALDGLRKMQVDVVDRIDPADVRRLRAESDIRVIPYRIPTLHFIVFNDREPLLRHATFRRGLVYALNRQGFAHDVLGAKENPQVAQLISGPLPRGLDGDDPLGYAYDPRITPRPFDPSLAFVLMRLAVTQAAQATEAQSGSDKSKPTTVVASTGGKQATADAESSQAAATAGEATHGKAAATDPIQFPSLVLAYPGSDLAEAGCSAIANDLRRLGIVVNLRELEASQVIPNDRDWDLLYCEASLEEPFVDLPRLIIGRNLLGRHGGPFWQAVRALQEVQTWDQVRAQFQRVHQLCHDDVPLIPLWQVAEHMAIRGDLRGIGERPVSLYQHVEDWRVTP